MPGEATAEPRFDAIYVVDVGTPSSGFAWVVSEGGHVEVVPQDDPSTSRCAARHGAHTCLLCLAGHLETRLRDGARVSLGFESPLLVPSPQPEEWASKRPLVVEPRRCETPGGGTERREWYSGPGATTFAIGLTELIYLFRALRGRSGLGGLTVTTDHDLGVVSGPHIVVWEAFVSWTKERAASRFPSDVFKGESRRKDLLAARLALSRYDEHRNGVPPSETIAWSNEADDGSGQDMLNVVSVAAGVAGVSFVGDPNTCWIVQPD